MLIGYRCKVCGAPVDPETGYCHYCDTLNFKPVIDRSVKIVRPQIIIRRKENEIKITPVELSLRFEQSADMAGRDIDGYIHKTIMRQYVKIDVGAIIAPKDMGFIFKPDIFDCVITNLKPGYAHNFKAYLNNPVTRFSPNVVPETELEIVSINPVDLWNEMKLHKPIPIGMKCPICGADLDPEKPKCDYCGYFWRLIPEGI